MTDQLIHLPKVETTEQSETVVTTPFQAFLAALEERQTHGVLRSMHSAIWSAVPIERLLVDAGWTLASLVAGKLGLTFSTHKEVRLAAQLTDQMVNVGLMLVHGTPEAAAEAFEVKVIGAINLALANGYRPGHTLSKVAWRALGVGQTAAVRNELRGQKVQAFSALTSLWTMPSFLFLFDCYKASRDLCDDLAGRLATFKRRNMIPTGRLLGSEKFDQNILPYVDDSNVVAEAIAYLDIAGTYLDVDRSPEYRVRKGKIDEVLVASSAMEQMELRLSTLLAVPVDFSALSSEALISATSMEASWVRGQVLCAVAGHRGESLPGVMLGKAVKVAKLTSIKKLVDQTVNAILERGTKWTVEQVNCFSELCMYQAREVHLSSIDSGVESSQESMTVVSLDSIKITSEKALEILLDGDQAINGVLDQMSNSEARAFLKKKILPKIDWLRFTAEQVADVINYKRVPLDMLLDGVAKMDAKERAEAVRSLLHDQIDPEDGLMTELAKRGMLVVDQDLVQAHAEEIPSDLMFNWLMADLERVKLLGVGMRFRAISRLKKSHLQQLMRIPAMRLPVVDMVSVLIRASARHDHEIEDSKLNDLQLLFGRDLWREYVVAALVYDRISELGLVADSEYPRLSWLEMANNDHTDFVENNRAMLTTSYSQLPGLLATYTEERAFRFLHEGNPEVERLWADYLAH